MFWFQIQTPSRNTDPRIGPLNVGKSEWCSKIKMAVVLSKLRAVNRNGTRLFKKKKNQNGVFTLLTE